MQPAVALLLNQMANRIIFNLAQLLRIDGAFGKLLTRLFMASGRKKLPTISARNGAC
jgi:hypothetical protein